MLTNLDLNQRYQYCILQAGDLPLAPNGARRNPAEHRCTVTLVWPHNQAPVFSNTLVIDPCFTMRGFEEAQARLGELHCSLAGIGRVFVTHLHGDHIPRVPFDIEKPCFTHFQPPPPGDLLAGLATTPLTGHALDLRGLIFTLSNGRKVWVVGDAILNQSWLEAWGYYWPNRYTPPQIIQTWRSVAHIIAGADWIIPGHGEPVAVTAALVSRLLDNFASACYSAECPDVPSILADRLARESYDTQTL